MNEPQTTATPLPKSLKNIATAGYALQAASFFLGGVPAIVAVILAYIKRDDASDTWLETHFRWQIRTFWFGLIWGVLGAALIWGWLIGAVLVSVVGFVILIADVIWLIYRIAKGWLALIDGKSPYPAV